MPVTITIVSPTADVAPGSPGGFPTDPEDARWTPIVLEITGADYEIVTATYPSMTGELAVYLDDDFRPGFALRSSQEAITDGVRLTILPDGGWPGTSALHDVTLFVDGVEASGPPPSLWDVDATSSIAHPSSMAQWNALFDDAGASSYHPAHAWRFGDPAAGSIPDLAGIRDLSVVHAPTTYQCAVSGWSALGLEFTAGAQDMIANAAFANVNANPYLLFLVGQLTAIGATTRTICRIGDNFDDDAAVETNATPRHQLGEGFGAPRKAGTINATTGGTRFWVLQIDPVTFKGCVLYTNDERISAPRGGTWANGTNLTFGGDNSSTWFPPGMKLISAALCTGAAARMPSNLIHSVLTTMGFAPPVYPWNMVKTTGGASYDAGARSVETFAGDFYVEWEVGNAGDYWACGFSSADPDQDYVSIGFAAVNDSGPMYRYASGVGALLGITTVSGDKWRVRRVGTTVDILQNGVSVYTFGGSSSGAVFIDTAIRTNASTLHNIRVSVGGVDQAITWQNVVNAAVY